MSAKYYVLMRGRWRELCVRSGRVGARRAGFAFARRGRLRVARARDVLRGLRALAAGAAGPVADAAPLPHRRKRVKRARCSGCHGCCSRSLKQNIAPKEIHTETVNRVEAAVQVSEVTPAQTQTAGQPQTEATQNEGRSLPPKVIPSRPHSTTSEGSQEDLCKELLINEDDVALYRGYLIKHDPEFDLYRFDADDSYKLTVFYKINPLVNIEKCHGIERMLRGSQSSQETMSLKDFATKLGLRSLSDDEADRSRKYKLRRRRGASGEDKENSARNGNNLNGVKKIRMVEAVKRNIVKTDTEAKRASSPKTMQAVPKVSSKVKPVITLERMPQSALATNKPVHATIPTRPFNGYTSVEDHAIVAFVSAGDRANRVNGNQIWRELQQSFPAVTGTERTWHSLRNRYLRYILPALPRMALPPPQQRRLRAAAAAGEIKAHKRSEPYPFSAPAVKSAWAARPRPPREATPPSPELTNSRHSRSPDPPPSRARRKSSPAKNRESPPRSRNSHSHRLRIESSASPHSDRELSRSHRRSNRLNSSPDRTRRSHAETRDSDSDSSDSIFVRDSRRNKSKSSLNRDMNHRPPEKQTFRRDRSGRFSKQSLDRSRTRKSLRYRSPSPSQSLLRGKKRDLSPLSPVKSTPRKSTRHRSRSLSASPIRRASRNVALSSSDSEDGADRRRQKKSVLKSANEKTDVEEAAVRSLRSTARVRRTRRLYNHNARPL